MSNPSDAFHRHLDCCAHCQRHPFDLCAVGQPLLVAAATEPMPPPPPSAVEQVIAERRQLPRYGEHEVVRRPSSCEYVNAESLDEAIDAAINQCALLQRVLNETRAERDRAEAILDRVFEGHRRGCAKRAEDFNGRPTLMRSYSCTCGAGCPHGDKLCPCQDGDPCNHEPLPSAVLSSPVPSPALLQVIADLQLHVERNSGANAGTLKVWLTELTGASPVLVTRMRNEDDEKVTRVDTLSHDVSTARNDRDGQRGTE